MDFQKIHSDIYETAEKLASRAASSDSPKVARACLAGVKEALDLLNSHSLGFMLRAESMARTYIESISAPVNVVEAHRGYINFARKTEVDLLDLPTFRSLMEIYFSFDPAKRIFIAKQSSSSKVEFQALTGDRPFLGQ